MLREEHWYRRDSRAAIDDLRAVAADLGEAVREKANRFTQAIGIPCGLELTERKGLAVADDVSAHVLHVLSEALANVARHAQATQVTVRLLIQGNQCTLEVRDNGQGFDAAQPAAAGHYGLLGIHERARLCGGSLTVESTPGKGTTVRFVAPGEEIERG